MTETNENTGVHVMKTIALSAAALLVAAGSAFAGSDHFNPEAVNHPATSNVDSSYTASVTDNGRYVVRGQSSAYQPVIEGNTRLTVGNR
jgi:hypothetical protein